MNILERIEKMEAELQELKEMAIDSIDAKTAEVEEGEYVPRSGEIVELSDDGNEWVVVKLTNYDGNDVFPYEIFDGTRYLYCRPLQDKMVIQLIPHEPNGEMPCDGAVIVLFQNGTYDFGNAEDFDWSGKHCIPEYKIVGWWYGAN